ncbi:hypothetical protein [Streptomyces sp. SM14]|uniref:hypothetical protein n=1 Tax=Streptomyces sp. SM14 TaxID=1736045 RepID=UPI000CD4C54C|nr:hypothetical protein [Streptomyces sp. SM14]
MTPAQLSDAVLRSVRDAAASGALGELGEVTGPDPGTPADGVRLRRPPHGDADWATGIALRLAGPARLPARGVAEAVAERLRDVPGVASVDVAGPGFLNIRLAPGAATALLADILAGPAPSVLPEDPARDIRAWAAASGDRAVTPAALLVQRAENPLFRVRYAHARTRALLRGASALGFAPDTAEAALLEAPAELRLLALLGERHSGGVGRLTGLADALLDADERAPALPLGPEKPRAVHRARLALAQATGTVLADGLFRLGIGAPDHL